MIDQVVCIDDNWRPDLLPEQGTDPATITFPVKDMVYTIRACLRFEGADYLYLEEIRNPEPQEVLFIADNFRALRHNSIDQFTSILIDAPKQLEPV